MTTFLEQGQVFNHFPTAVVNGYSVTKHLKTGGQGEAYLGATRTGAIVVIKYLKNPYGKAAAREWRYSHERFSGVKEIQQITNRFQDRDGRLFFVLQWRNMGDLSAWIGDSRRQQLTPEQKKSIALQMFRGLR